MNKIVSPEAAAAMIPDHCCIWLAAGGGGINEPARLLKAIEKEFETKGHPAGVTLCHSAGIGDKKGGGVDRFAHEGMVKRVIGSHWTWSVEMQKLAAEEKIDAFVLPQGTMTQLPREIAGARPGVITQVGLGTFVDPRIEGGALNRRSLEHKDDLTEVVKFGEKEYLRYKSFPIDVALLRGTTADEEGNISVEEEGMITELLSAAQAAKNSGGIVIVQVKRLVQAETIPPKMVQIPGILVDAVVVDPQQRQSEKTYYNPSYSGECRLSVLSEERTGGAEEKLADIRRVIARRAAKELKPGDVVNLGFGMPDGVAKVLKEEGRDHETILTIEQGIIGGVPAGGTDFGMAMNPTAIVDQPYQFDWYDGGGLDVAVLSFAQFDSKGNVNVSCFGGHANGVGGFINISQATKTVLFVGTLTTGGLMESCDRNGLKISREGKVKKAVKEVEQISFSGEFASKNGRNVLFITERAVFKLTQAGIELLETAPGIDLKRDVLEQMGFMPIIHKNEIMDLSLFRE